ncbi:MAG TPA: hypothetical protein VLA75_04035, partial [Thermoanaerobaculia bacterium]|nr:hypothetical protein [Thermoanaerobaculia bacterium]
MAEGAPRELPWLRRPSGLPAAARHLLAPGVAAVALAVRLLYLAQSAELPWNRVPIGDGKAYFDWAAAIAAGDLWSRAQGVFYQAPLYPYLLALLQIAGLGEPATVRLLQSVLGALACGLLAHAGGRWFGPGPGALAGLLLALSPTAVFLDGSLDKSALAGALTVAFAALALPHATGVRPHALVALAAGASLGLLALVRESALVWLALPLFARLAAPRREGAADPGLAGARRRAWLAFFLGAAAVLGAVALRNGLVGGAFVPTTAQSGPNFFIGNRRGASGSYEPLLAGRGDARFERADARALAEGTAGRPLSDAAVSRWWWRRGLAEVAADPAAAARGFLRKLRLAVHRYEVPDVDDLGLAAEASPLLAALDPAFGFGLLTPLAAAGALLSWRRPAARVLAALGASLALATAAFFVLGRYRAPLAPLFALLAAGGLAELVDRRKALRAGARLRPLAAAALAGLVAMVAIAPIPAERPA